MGVGNNHIYFCLKRPQGKHGSPTGALSYSFYYCPHRSLPPRVGLKRILKDYTDFADCELDCLS